MRDRRGIFSRFFLPVGAAPGPTGKPAGKPCRAEHRDVPLRGARADRKALSRWEPRRCPLPNRRTGSTFLRYVSMVAVRHWPISALGAPQPPTWRVGPALPCGILAKNPNYREARWLAQVVSILGAGVWGVWRRCGKWVGTCATGGRRRPICGAGPPSKNTPAPRKPGTCAGVPGKGARPQPEIRGACPCALEAPVRPNPMLRQPKLPRGASRCATEGRAAGMGMRCEFWVGEIRRSPRNQIEPRKTNIGKILL